jgi:hypothetical protein
MDIITDRGDWLDLLRDPAIQTSGKTIEYPFWTDPPGGKRLDLPGG